MKSKERPLTRSVQEARVVMLLKRARPLELVGGEMCVCRCLK